MADYTQRAFNAGEICEEAQGRDDIAQAARGVRLARNGMFQVQGGWRRRKGTWYVAAPKDGAADFQLQPFTRAYGQSVMLELGFSGAGYFRVYGLDRARVGTVEVATTFLQAELNGGLSFLQSGDILHAYRRNNTRPQVITRAAAETWTIANLSYRHGPWLPENITSIEFDMTGGTAIATGGAVFNALHVGAKFLIRPGHGYNMDAWHSEWRPPDAGYCLSAGYIYQMYGSFTYISGSNPPVHTSGVINDGGLLIAGQGSDLRRGVNWSYLHDGAAIFTISSISGPGSAFGTFAGNDPFSGDEAKTTRWRESAYNNYRGWPGMAACVREQRIVTGCTAANPDTLDLTRTNGWDLTSVDYKPGLGTGLVAGDDGIRLSVGGEGAPLMWALDHQDLIVASAKGLYALSGGGVDGAMTPTNYLLRGIGGEGSSAVLPAETGMSILYVPVSRRALLELSSAGGDYAVADIGLLFTHVTGKGVAQVVWMGAPWYQAVLRLDDGSVAFVTYAKEQNVLACASQDFGGRVFTVAVVAGSDGLPQLWMGIDRGTAETPKRSIEVMAGFYDDMYLDSAQFYAGAATNAVSGLGRFNGMEIEIRATDAENGDQWHKGRAVASGSATLGDGKTSAYIVAGLSFRSRLEFMPLGEAREAWALTAARPDRLRFRARFTHCKSGSTDDETADAQPEIHINKGQNGAWMEKLVNTRAVLFATTGDDKRVYIETASPFDLVVYSARLGVGL